MGTAYEDSHTAERQERTQRICHTPSWRRAASKAGPAGPAKRGQVDYVQQAGWQTGRACS